MSSRSRLYVTAVGFTIVLLCLLNYRSDKIVDMKFMEKSVHEFTDGPAFVPTEIKIYDVLVVGYLRGGTTFIGEILGFKNGSFYMYEPLNKLLTWGYMDDDLLCSMTDQTCRISANMTGENILDIVRGIYSCDSQKYQHLLKSWHGRKSIGPAQREMAMCTHSNTKCMETYLKQCSTASSKVSKIPRISIGLASKLLLEFRNLKIIHILRDPRAVMNSRYKLRWAPVPGGAVSLCKKMKKDYQQSVKLRRLFPGRIHTVFYEDLTQNFDEAVKEIYSFVGYQLNAKEQIRLSGMTSSSKDGNAGSTHRRNSSITARAWRQSINTNVLIETNKACSDLYQLFGYSQLESEIDVRNTSIPLRISVK